MSHKIIILPTSTVSDKISTLNYYINNVSCTFVGFQTHQHSALVSAEQINHLIYVTSTVMFT